MQSRTACSRRRAWRRSARGLQIHLAKAIENGAAYAEFRVVLELHVLAGIVFAHGVHQAEDSGVDEVFEQHLRRQAIVDAPGDVLHLRKVLEKELFALRAGKFHRRPELASP